jgi:ribosomal protein L18
MNLSTSFQQLFHPKKPQKELYLSLTLSHSHVGACAWSMDSDGELMVAAAESKKLGNNTWENRIEIADQLIEKLSEYANTDAIHQVVFGLSQDMLTTSGDIEKGIKPELKKLSTMLDLTPVGFVNIDTAVVFQIKHDEGVPPSVILLHVQGEEMFMSLYRVGICAGSRTIPKTEFIVEDVETAIKSYSDIEVLPSRILLFGDDRFSLETIQSQLLTHQWPNRVNFLHYPKIDVMSMEDVARAVALAGASELASTIGIDIEEQEDAPSASEAKSRSAGEAETVVAQPVEEIVMGEEMVEKIEPLSDDKDMVEEIDDAFDKDIDKDEDEKLNKAKSRRVGLEEFEIRPEDANVIAVSPEVLGFRQYKEEQTLPKKEKIVSKIMSVLTNIHIPQIPKIPIHGIALPIGIIGIMIVGLLGFLYYFLPKVTITVGVMPQVITKEKAVTISTLATVVDAEKFIVPGKKQEKSITGEKIIPVTGKKKIGDPARGSVTLYNKTTATKSLKKGTVIETNSLAFTLDSDVEVASASESIGSITFGTTNAAVSASAIGEEGNIGTNTEFSVKGYDTSVLIARNGQAFTGGTSRQATVVSRADYDALVQALTDELVATAKAELLQEVTGGEKLIEQTIKTTVTSKTFTEELDQEAKELHGKATITVTGTSYKEEDIKTLLFVLASKDIQVGFIMNEGRTTITVTSPVLKKDGTITAQASIRLVAIPKIDVDVIRKSLVGKSFISAQEQLKKIQGVGSAEFIFKPWRGNKKLPLKATNIAIEVVIVE